MRTSGVLTRSAIFIASALLLAACGSTVPSGTTQARPVDAGLGTTDGSGPGSLTTTAGNPAVGRLPTAGAPLRPGSGGPTDTQGASPGGLPSAGVAGGATTGKVAPVKVGMIVVDDANEYLGGLGFSVDVGDQEQQSQAMARWVNAHGGLGGAKLDLVLRHTKTADSTSRNTYQQSNCTDFTEDRPVQFVLDYNYYTGPFVPCLVQHGVAYINAGAQGPSDTLLRSHGPFIYEPGMVNYTRAARLMVNGLTDAAFLTGKSRIGYFRPDNSEFERAETAGLRPALAARGLKLTDAATLSSDASQWGSTASSAVLKFKSQNIDRVVFSGLGSITFFAIAAEGQDYHPRYGFTTDVNPIGTASLVPHQQLEGSAGVGWQPAEDVGYTHPGGKPGSSNDALCHQIMTDAGVNMTSDTVAFLAIDICDAFLFLKFGLDKSGGSSIAQFAAAIAAHPSSYQSPLTFDVDMSGMHDGAHRYRLSRWDAACPCFVYSSPQRAIPD